MMLKLAAGLLCLLVFPTGTAHAQDSLSIDPHIEWVATGGRWAAAGREGSYRVIIRTGGTEHSVSDLTVEWLAEAPHADDPTVFKSILVAELNDIGRLDRPKIGHYLKGWRLWVEQTDTHSSSGTTTRALDLGPPGVIKVRPAR